MAWEAGADVTTGDLITAAQWNSYLGATGSIEYLKTEADKLDDISQATPAKAEDTIYQNTTCYMRVVLITANIDAGEQYEIEVEDATPPTTKVGYLGDSGTPEAYPSITFFVPYGWYYRCATADGNPTIKEWAEWDLH